MVKEVDSKSTGPCSNLVAVVFLSFKFNRAHFFLFLFFLFFFFAEKQKKSGKKNTKKKPQGEFEPPTIAPRETIFFYFLQKVFSLCEPGHHWSGLQGLTWQIFRNVLSLLRVKKQNIKKYISKIGEVPRFNDALVLTGSSFDLRTRKRTSNVWNRLGGTWRHKKLA